MSDRPTILQRLARERIPDLLRGGDGILRGTCPACGHMPPVSNRGFEVYDDFFACGDCGIRGTATDLLRCNDGATLDEARAVIARMEARR